MNEQFREKLSDQINMTSELQDNTEMKIITELRQDKGETNSSH